MLKEICRTQVYRATAPGQSQQALLRLLQCCQQGNTTAFDEIVAHYQNRIYNLCFWMLSDPEEASDATQDAFVRAFQSINKFRGESDLSTWLHRIAVNTCLDATRRRKRAALPFSALKVQEVLSYNLEPIDRGLTPAQITDRQERSRIVQEALISLAQHHRIMLVLLDIQGLSYEEVTMLLNVPLGTVKSRLYRARLALRQKLEPQKELLLDP